MSELPAGALDGEIELIIAAPAGDVVTCKNRQGPATATRNGASPKQFAHESGSAQHNHQIAHANL
jgi:hypothetical protein